MDIDLLSKMVKELILDNDRVVLPGLGAFVAEMVPSTFSDRGYTINPPYRRMFFRAKPVEGSELAELYARANRIDIASADRIIRDFVAELKAMLYTKKTVTFPGLGRLRATKENNVFFVADEELDIYPAGFGLEPISLKTHQETREEVAAAVVDLKSILTGEEEKQEEIIPGHEDIILVEEEAPEESPEVTFEEPAEDEIAVEDEEEALIEEEIAVEEKKSAGKILLTVLGIIIVAALVLTALLALLGRTNPELIDRILFSKEELEIINSIV